MFNPQMIGYARVSSTGQSLEQDDITLAHILS